MSSFLENVYVRLLFAFNLLYFVVISLFVSFDINKSEFLVNFGALSNSTIQNLQFWDIILANFVHLDFFHFFFNMFALIQISNAVARIINNDKFLIIIYFCSGIVASLFSIIFYMVLLNVSFISIGASGAIFGFIGFILGIQFSYKLHGDITFRVNLSNLYFIIFFSILLTLVGVNNINHAAHFGGLVGGVILGFMYKEINLNTKLVNILYNSSIFVFGISVLFMIVKFGLNLFSF